MTHLLILLLILLGLAAVYIFVIDTGIVALDTAGVLHLFGRTYCVVEQWGCWTP